jgi:hypothetical protein
MSQFKHNSSGVITQPVPLFASSWAALFALLRHGVGETVSGKTVSGKTPKTGGKDNSQV